MAPLRQFLKNYERDYFHTFFRGATRQYNHSKLWFRDRRWLVLPPRNCGQFLAFGIQKMAPLCQFLKKYELDYFYTFFLSATHQYNHSKLWFRERRWLVLLPRNCGQFFAIGVHIMALLGQFLKNCEHDYLHIFFWGTRHHYNHFKLSSSPRSRLVLVSRNHGCFFVIFV